MILLLRKAAGSVLNMLWIESSVSLSPECKKWSVTSPDLLLRTAISFSEHSQIVLTECVVMIIRPSALWRWRNLLINPLIRYGSSPVSTSSMSKSVPSWKALMFMPIERSLLLPSPRKINGMFLSKMPTVVEKDPFCIMILLCTSPSNATPYSFPTLTRSSATLSSCVKLAPAIASRMACIYASCKVFFDLSVYFWRTEDRPQEKSFS